MHVNRPPDCKSLSLCHPERSRGTPIFFAAHSFRCVCKIAGREPAWIRRVPVAPPAADHVASRKLGEAKRRHSCRRLSEGASTELSVSVTSLATTMGTRG